MAKSKSTENQADNNPFGGFKILQGQFPEPPAADDEIITGDESILKDEPLSDDEKQRIIAADEKLKKVTEKTAKALKVKETQVENQQDASDSDEESEDEVEDTTETDELESDDEQGGLIKEFAKNLYDKGVIDFNDQDEEFEESEEGIEKLVNKTIENRINNWVSNLPEDYSKFLEFVQNGGKPKDFLNVYYGNHSWETFNLDNENNQQIAVEESLKLSGENDDDIRDMIEEWRDNGTLEKRAKSALNKLQKNEAYQKAELVEIQKEQALKQRKAQQEYWNNFKNDLYKKEEIKGFKLTPKLKDKLWEHMTAVDKNSGKTAYQKAVEQDQEASLLFALQSMLGFDISKLEKQVESKVSNKFGKMLKNYSKSSKDKISGGLSEERNDSNPFSAFKTIK